MVLLKVRKANKYLNKKVIVDGILFDSKKEAGAYSVLKLLEKQGIISDLELQPKYELLVNDIKIGIYIADFKFYDKKKKRWRVTDVKGIQTKIFRRNKKHLKAQYGIDVEVWDSKNYF